MPPKTSLIQEAKVQCEFCNNQYGRKGIGRHKIKCEKEYRRAEQDAVFLREQQEINGMALLIKINADYFELSSDGTWTSAPMR